jgi:formate dehydrogenase maturation protein FdhE
VSSSGRSQSALWERRVRRAEQLAANGGPMAPLLEFYGRVLQQQRIAYESFGADQLTGSIDGDAGKVAQRGVPLLHEVVKYGSGALASEASALLDSGGQTFEARLLEYWRTRSDRDFFSKALCQPYGQWLADTVGTASGTSPTAENRCPRCGGVPQIAILNATGSTTLDGDHRQLQCATCLTIWPFRRVVCPSCGEEDERKLGYYRSAELDHVRVDACESCGHYLKAIDLGRLGLAVPLVDEVAAAALDVWASDHGYTKVELNLIGL